MSEEEGIDHFNPDHPYGIKPTNVDVSVKGEPAITLPLQRLDKPSIVIGVGLLIFGSLVLAKIVPSYPSFSGLFIIAAGIYWLYAGLRGTRQIASLKRMFIKTANRLGRS